MEELEKSRHSLSHVLAKAVKNLFKGVKVAIGPAIENGFYYDFDLPDSILQEDFEKIEKEMHRILNANEPFIREEISKEDALKLFADEPYKIELIKDLPKNEIITIYKTGDYVDLCRGPHVENTSKLQNWGFKIERNSGAYWRGNVKNKMLQRIYVNAFPSKKELAEFLEKKADALKRDHNKLGRELEYFTTVDVIGQGLPILLPNGARTIQLMQRWVEDTEEKNGYLLTKTPFFAKSDFYKISGHWDHYRDGMFIMGDENKDEEVFALRPMTCPFQFQVYLNKLRSYKELPMRLNETSTLFRNESSGEMHGLIRVRQFTIAEGHLACLPSQLESEFKGCLDLANYFIKTLGFENDITYRFSKWDPNNKEKYIGDANEWEKVQNEMKKILTDLKIEHYEAEGEAAFYGPKLDVQMKNVFGKEDTIITIQIDFQLAKRFNMEYVDADGTRKFPYVIHRTSLGCYERTLALLIEKYAGALPIWLMPKQVKVLSITERSENYAKEICAKLINEGVRADVDVRNEKIGYKIREASSQKIPYLIIVGDSEVEQQNINVRKRGNFEQHTMLLNDLIAEIKEKINTKAIN